jgi:hypothetical protein
MATVPTPLQEIYDLEAKSVLQGFDIEFNNVLLNYNNLVEEILDKEFNKKPKKSNPYSNTAQQNLVIQYFKIELEKETANKVFNIFLEPSTLALSSKKKQKKADNEMIAFLKSKMTSAEILTKYNSGGTLHVPSVVTPPVPVVTALATATPITATGIPIVTPVVASTTTATPYEIILDTDKMKFFVYNLFAHDLAHDLFPSGTGLKRVEEIKVDTANPTRTSWFNVSHDNSTVSY